MRALSHFLHRRAAVPAAISRLAAEERGKRIWTWNRNCQSGPDPGVVAGLGCLLRPDRCCEETRSDRDPTVHRQCRHSLIRLFRWPSSARRFSSPGVSFGLSMVRVSLFSLPVNSNGTW